MLRSHQDGVNEIADGIGEGGPDVFNLKIGTLTLFAPQTFKIFSYW